MNRYLSKLGFLGIVHNFLSVINQHSHNIFHLRPGLILCLLSVLIPSLFLKEPWFYLECQTKILCFPRLSRSYRDLVTLQSSMTCKQRVAVEASAFLTQISPFLPLLSFFSLSGIQMWHLEVQQLYSEKVLTPWRQEKIRNRLWSLHTSLGLPQTSCYIRQTDYF